MMTALDRAQESRIRSRAQCRGYRVEKSRQREHLNNQGQFMLVQNDRNMVALGVNYDATLEEIEEFLTQLPSLRLTPWRR
jgi:hypothetical protein